jgi:hypothetical protein
MRRLDILVERGVALITVLLLMSLLTTLAVGLSLGVTLEGVANGNHADAARLEYAAQAGLELAVRDLSGQPDWDAVLAGDVQAALADGAPSGTRSLADGGTLDLAAQTDLLNCARSAPCTSAQLVASTRDRPWGANNPIWRPFLYGPLDRLAAFSRPSPCYVVVWVGDDAREEDGDPLADGGTVGGRGVLRLRADAFGPRGARRGIDAEIARVCVGADGAGPCLPGLRVQSWREVRQALP